MMPQLAQERPTIRMHVARSVQLPRLRELVLGVEEEAVPLFIEVVDDASAVLLAHEASIAAPLAIGIGVDQRTVAVTTDKLPAERPYLTTALNHSAVNDRSIGANAARLVKRSPLLPIERSPHVGTGNN